MKNILERYNQLRTILRIYAQHTEQTSNVYLPNPYTKDSIDSTVNPVKPSEISVNSSTRVCSPHNEVTLPNLVKNMPLKYSVEPSLSTVMAAKTINHPLTIKETSNSFEDIRNLLESEKTIEKLPSSPVKPSYISDAAFTRICSSTAFLDYTKDGDDVIGAMLTAGFTVGFPGHNLDKMQTVVPYVKKLRGTRDFTSNMSENTLTQLGDKELGQITNLTLKEPLRITEYVAQAKVNPSQEVKLTYAKGENPDPRSLSGYNNQTPNVNPDFVSYLPQPVGNITAVGYDFKYILGRIDNKNIVKGCTINAEQHVLEAHEQLIRILKQHVKSNVLSTNNRITGERLLTALDDNITMFEQSKDLNATIYSYNSLRNEFGTFLLENKIGMTLLAHLDKSDFVIAKNTQNAFVDKFMDYYTNPNSSLVEFLDKHADANFGQIPNENHCLTALAKTMFPDK